MLSSAIKVKWPAILGITGLLEQEASTVSSERKGTSFRTFQRGVLSRCDRFVNKFRVEIDAEELEQVDEWDGCVVFLAVVLCHDDDVVIDDATYRETTVWLSAGECVDVGGRGHSRWTITQLRSDGRGL